MSWHAKPSSAYSVGSVENNENTDEIWSILYSYGYTEEAAAGVLGNIQAESGNNPWRWQNDTVSPTYSNGYGLFQYTPASGYINLSGTTPNLSTSTQTPGATPEDGSRQVQCYASNELRKWVSSAWRPYWSTTTYASLYAKRNQWLATWGSNDRISMSQFKVVTDLEAAAFFHLACFEGPSVPDLATRYAYAQVFYAYIHDEPTPPVPPVPPVPPTPSANIPVWLMLAIKNNSKRNIDKNI